MKFRPTDVVPFNLTWGEIRNYERKKKRASLQT